MLSVILLAGKKLMIMHYTTALNALKKENDTNYWCEIIYAWAVIVTLQSAKTTLLAWHYFLVKRYKVGYFGYFTDRPCI